ESIVMRFDWNRRPALGAIERATGPKHGIADNLRFQAAQTLSPEELIAWIDRLWIRRIRNRGLSINTRGHNQLVERLHRPVVLDEFSGEPVEQLGMRRPRPEVAEVVRRDDDAFAKVALPDAVHEDAGRKRMIGPSQPTGPCHPPTAAWRPGAQRNLDGGV